MGTILFECPKTGRAVSTGIENLADQLLPPSETWLKVYCPLCGHFHGANNRRLRKRRLQWPSARALQCEKTRR